MIFCGKLLKDWYKLSYAYIRYYDVENHRSQGRVEISAVFDEDGEVDIRASFYGSLAYLNEIFKKSFKNVKTAKQEVDIFLIKYDSLKVFE